MAIQNLVRNFGFRVTYGLVLSIIKPASMHFKVILS